MIPKIVCNACGAELSSTDKFCSSCGEKVDWGKSGSQSTAAKSPVTPKEVRTADSVCPSCGHRNPTNASFCESCGTTMKSKSGSQASPGKKPKEQSKLASPLQFFQSWKFTVTLALLLVIVLMYMKMTKNDQSSKTATPNNPHAPNQAAMINEIDALQKTVDANPDDEQSILRLANLLHDVRFYPRAIMEYKRYLVLQPTNADARVDLGTSYFEMSFEDSAHVPQYLDSARTEMTKALTYQPKHQLACFNLGIVMFHTGDMKEAMQWFSKCVAIDSTNETGKRALQFVNQHSSINK
jgi:cytochrome c-type biogenesis protein CcmH/NrfG/ribosomal protein L40E